MGKRDLLNRYYTAVMDVEMKSGTVDNMEIVQKVRVFNNKFVNSPELALLIAFDEYDERWKVHPSEIMHDIVYDEENKEWKRTFLETTKGHLASEKQIEKWQKGEYVLNLITEYVQVMETVLIDDKNLVDKSIDTWNKKMYKLKELKDKKHNCNCNKNCKCNYGED